MKTHEASRVHVASVPPLLSDSESELVQLLQLKRTASYHESTPNASINFCHMLRTSGSASTARPSPLDRSSLPQPSSVAHHKARGASAWPAPHRVSPCVILSEQHHLPSDHEVAGLEAVKVDAGRQRVAIVSSAVPNFLVDAGFTPGIHERANT